MGQFVGILGLLLSETPVLLFNVTRYTIVLKQTMNNIHQNDTRFCINQIFSIYFLLTKHCFSNTSRCY
jgi:hypothetical protein